MTSLLEAGHFRSLSSLLWSPELFGVCGVPLGYQSSVCKYYKLAFSRFPPSRVCEAAAPCPASCTAGAVRVEQCRVWVQLAGVGRHKPGWTGMQGLCVLWFYWAAGVSISALGQLALLPAPCHPAPAHPGAVTRFWFPHCFVDGFAPLQDMLGSSRMCLKAQKSGFFLNTRVLPLPEQWPM